MNRMNLRLAASLAFCVFGARVFWVATLNETGELRPVGAAPRFFQGLGLAFFFLPLNQIMLAGVRPDELASASGLSNFVRTMSGSFATAVTVWIWNTRTDYHHAVLSEHVRNGSVGWAAYQAKLDTLGIAGTGAFQYVDRLIGQQASTLGVSDVFRMIGWLFVLLVPAVWLAKPPFGARAAPR